MLDDDDRLTPDDETLGERLVARRPVPSAGFRGALGRHLAVRDPGFVTRPQHLRLLASGYLTVGGILLGLGLLQALGRL
jgi:hypothetical protein